jgi:hypothetical protein
MESKAAPPNAPQLLFFRLPADKSILVFLPNVVETRQGPIKLRKAMLFFTHQSTLKLKN